MAVTRTPEGRTQRILQNGIWRDVTEDEAEVLAEGAIQSTGRAAKASGGGLLGLLELLGSAAPSASRGRAGFSPLQQQFQADMQQSGLDRLVSTGEELDELERLRPGPAFAGQVLTEGLTELATGGFGVKSLARRGAREVAEGVAEGQARQTARRAVGAANDPNAAIDSEDITAIGGLVGDSAGAMSRSERSGLWRTLKRSPALKNLLEKIEDQIGTQRATMSPDQRELLASGNAERLGFSFLPGQESGNNLIAEVIKSQPFMADAFDDVLAGNAQQFGNHMRRALGLGDGTIGRNTFAEADREFSRRFGNVANSVNDFTLPTELRNALDDPEILTKNARFLFKVSEEGQPLTGTQAMELRSRVNDALSAASSDRAQGVKADHILEQLNDLDDLIAGNIEGGKGSDVWQGFMADRQKWRVNLAFNRPGSFTPGGDLSIKGLSGNLERMFQREFKKRLFQRDEAGRVIDDKMPEEVADLLDFTRIARDFESNLGDSGTASRLAIQQILSGGIKQYAKQRVAARFITDVLLDRPDIAAGLPN